MVKNYLTTRKIQEILQNTAKKQPYQKKTRSYSAANHSTLQLPTLATSPVAPAVSMCQTVDSTTGYSALPGQSVLLALRQLHNPTTFWKRVTEFHALKAVSATFDFVPKNGFQSFDLTFWFLWLGNLITAILLDCDLAVGSCEVGNSGLILKIF